MKRSDLLRALVRRCPYPFRALLTLAANGWLPRRIYGGISRHWLGQLLLEDLFPLGVRVWSPPLRLYVSPLVAHTHGQVHRLDRRVFLQALAPGMTVIDVGASSGFFTLLAARTMGATGHIHAVEPSPRALARLERNVRLSKARNVTIHPYAAGRRRERKIFHVTTGGGTDGFHGSDFSPTVETIDVSAVPLDEVIASPVHLVKIDVEGAEIEVLTGMTRILSESPALALLVEWNPSGQRRAGRDPLELPRFLQDHGFTALQVLDESAGRIQPLESVQRLLACGQLPHLWYANIWARRPASAAAGQAPPGGRPAVAPPAGGAARPVGGCG